MQDASETCCDGLETVTLAKDLELEAAERSEQEGPDWRRSQVEIVWTRGESERVEVQDKGY